MAPETFTTVMDVNVTQSWLMAREVTKQMKVQGGGGKIVLVSSARGLLGHPAGYTAYCASKSAIVFIYPTMLSPQRFPPKAIL